jgi:CubicO group peptidase (beta-lactamase class C family)
MHALHAALNVENSGVRSFIVVREGRTVFEHFRHDVLPDTLEEINSITKSVVSLAVGIALTEGVLPALDTRLTDLLPQARDRSFDDRVQHITLRHLLTMTAGFEWDPGIIDDCVLGACERFSGDERLRFILSRRFAHAPGERFTYDSHAVQLLSMALERAAGRTLEQYTREKLFAPIGIDTYTWIDDEAGHTFAARGLMLRTRDAVKLGMLVQERGAGIVDTAFADDAVAQHIDGGPPHADARYGYLWWIAPRYVFAAGYGEQFVFAARNRRIVAAVTCDATDDPKHVRELFVQHVLSAADC